MEWDGMGWDGNVKKEEIILSSTNVIINQENHHHHPPIPCLCCLGCLDEDHVEDLTHFILTSCEVKDTKEVKLEISLPPILDAFRVAIRGLICMDINTTLPFPTFETILQRQLINNLKKKNIIVNNTTASWIVNITAQLDHQGQLCGELWPFYKIKKVKRKYWEVEQQLLQQQQQQQQPNIGQPEKDENEVLSRATIDNLLKDWKSMGKKDLMDLTNRVNTLIQSSYFHRVLCIPIFYHIPIYFYGRYCKYGRDISQSPWMIASTNNGNSTNSNNNNNNNSNENQEDGCEDGIGQKGSGNVEDLIGQVVRNVLNAEVVKLHGCGREDIDVRCLGNGRPFALEVIKSQYKCDVSIWEAMQKEAEEKDKQYSCVVWTATSITRDDLDRLEAFSRNEVDTNGRPCLQLVQKTPLRVLHRRSLIDRVRYVYNIHTVLLNNHFFIMSLDTSAGTYVKEFVHGDLGRTWPNVGSILNSEAQILQLDVTWLYDSFSDRLPISPNQQQTYSSMMKSLEEYQKLVHISQEELSLSRQPYYHQRMITPQRKEETEEQIVIVE
eukprot:scaffold5237_cov170-Ochromonas_danica.AAC.14